MISHLSQALPIRIAIRVSVFIILYVAMYSYYALFIRHKWLVQSFDDHEAMDLVRSLADAVFSIAYFLLVGLASNKKMDLIGFGIIPNRSWTRTLIVGFLIGCAYRGVPTIISLFSGEATISDRFYRPNQDQAFVLGECIGMTSALLIAIKEELIFRAYPIGTLLTCPVDESTKRKLYLTLILLTSLLFSAIHALNTVHLHPFTISVPAGVLQIFEIGVILAIMYRETRSIAMPIGFHAGIDFFSNNVIQRHMTWHTSLLLLGETGQESGVAWNAILGVWWLANAGFIARYLRATRNETGQIETSQNLMSTIA